MTFGPSLDSVFNIRFIKKAFCCAILCAATLLFDMVFSNMNLSTVLMTSVLLPILINIFIAPYIVKLPTLQSCDSPTENPFISDEQIKNTIVHMAVKAQLASVEPAIDEVPTLYAHSILGYNRVCIQRGLINAISAEGIRATLAHEVAHHTSFLDRIILKMSLSTSNVLCMKGFLLLASNFYYGLFTILGANFLYCKIFQLEEERADRMACHLVDEPKTALFGMNEKFVAINRHVQERSPGGYEFAKMLFQERLYIPMLLGLGTYPTDKDRLAAMEDEISKIEQAEASGSRKFVLK